MWKIDWHHKDNAFEECPAGWEPFAVTGELVYFRRQVPEKDTDPCVRVGKNANGANIVAETLCIDCGKDISGATRWHDPGHGPLCEWCYRKPKPEAQQVRTETLKAVGEWAKRKYNPTWKAASVDHGEIDTLLSGKMPE